MLKIGYFADGPWSHEAFKRIILNRDISIKFICVRFDTKDETLRGYCQKFNIPYYKHSNINSPEFIAAIDKYKCDLFVSMSFNQIFKANLINLTPHKAINCHAGKLPFYRGRNILNWALINDEKEFGITVHYIDEGIDTGDIILQEVYPITDRDDYETLLQKSYLYCADILYRAINLFVNNDVKRVAQSSIHPVGFYCPQRKIGDEVINWSCTSREIFNFVRAICSPGPQATSFVGGRQVKINSVELIKAAPIYKSTPGAILEKSENWLVVKTGDSFIKIRDYRCEGSLRVGDRFE